MKRKCCEKCRKKVGNAGWRRRPATVGVAREVRRGDCGDCVWIAGSRGPGAGPRTCRVSCATHQNVDLKKLTRKMPWQNERTKKVERALETWAHPDAHSPEYLRCPPPHPPCGMRATAMCMCGTVSLSHVLAAHAGAPAVRRNQQAPPRAVAPHVAARQLRRQVPPSFGVRRGDRRRHAILRDR